MISIIVAVAHRGVIGGNNRLLWHISEDLKRFKAITTGHPVVMGRKTYESLGRPLPNRTNVVVTRRSDFQAPGCVVVSSLEAAVALFPEKEEVFVIGGGEIYRQAMPLADKLYLTCVEADYEGDVFFPKVDPDEWCLTPEECHVCGEKFPYPFRFADYVRRCPGRK